MAESPFETAEFFQGVLDAAPQEIAILDTEGIVRFANAAWRRYFCDADPSADPSAEPGDDLGDDLAEGENLLAALEVEAQNGRRCAAQAREGIGEILDGRRDRFDMEYACESGSEKRCYLLDVARSEQAGIGAIVTRVDITDQKRLERRLERMAHHDDLTGLLSRARFLEEAERLVALAERNGRTLHLIYIDVDDFKQINDTYGHAVGDHVLRTMAKRLGRRVRSSDLVGRLGGDEFVALVESPESGDVVGGRYHQVLTEPVTIDGEPAVVLASLGVATYPRDGRGINQLLHAADHRMYVAKETRSGVATGPTLAGVGEARSISLH